VLNGTLAHIHEINPRKLERQILRTACKRKATDQISERPSQIITSGMLSTIRKFYKINISKFNWFMVDEIILLTYLLIVFLCFICFICMYDNPLFWF
jgi:hypothetical protein